MFTLLSPRLPVQLKRPVWSATLGIIVCAGVFSLFACGGSVTGPTPAPPPSLTAMRVTVVLTATPVPTANRTVARQDQGKWQMGSGSNDGNPQGNTDWITLVLSSDDGGYTGGALPDETLFAVLRLSCEVRSNNITAMVMWFEEVITDPTLAAVQVSVQFDDASKRDETWLVGSSPLGTFMEASHGQQRDYVQDLMDHDQFRVELEFVGGSMLWHEWTLDGLTGWLGQPTDLCLLTE